MFELLVQLHFASVCLVEPTKSQFFNLEDFERGYWKIHYRVLESVVLSLWSIGCFNNVSYALHIDCTSQFSIHYVRMELLSQEYITIMYAFHLKDWNSNFIVRFEHILPVNSIMPDIISFFYHEWWLNFIQESVLIYLFLFFFCKFLLLFHSQDIY